MSFLNPLWLLALPLVLLPIVIHLWNQRRHKIIHWGAMQFLIVAKRMSRGMARVRHWLIMAARMLAVAGIIFLITRPLATGWLGLLSGGKPETVLVLLDRSASMQQQSSLGGRSKLQTGVEKLVAALETLGSTSQVYLVDPLNAPQTTGMAAAMAAPSPPSDRQGDTPTLSDLSAETNSDPGDQRSAVASSDRAAAGRVIGLKSARDLLDLPEAQPTESAVDIPTMLQMALDFITNNQTGRTDIWILSDAAENDWAATSSRWQAINTAFAKLEGVRFHFLNYPEAPTANLSVRVERWERALGAGQPELVLDLSLRRNQAATSGPVEVPVTIQVGGVRSIVNVTIEGDTANLIGHRIPLDQEMRIGWGSVEIPADANPADNRFYFAFSDPAPWQTVLVSPNRNDLRGLELAAAVAGPRDQPATIKYVTPNQLHEVDWNATTLLIWHDQLPEGDVAKRLERFVGSGRSVLFLPPAEPNQTTFAGWTWGDWNKADGAGTRIGYWNNDADLWMKTKDGTALPLDELLVYQHCRLSGPGRVLAKLDSAEPLLVRSTELPGSAYALTTLPWGAYSSLDRDGIALFVLVQRALAQAAESQGAAKSFAAGTLAAKAVAERKRLSSLDEPNSSAVTTNTLKPYLAGVYGNEQDLIALNRPAVEETAGPLDEATLRDLFATLELRVIRDQLTSDSSLASEIWKGFVVVVIVALLVEAVLTLPEKQRATNQSDIAPSPRRAAA